MPGNAEDAESIRNAYRNGDLTEEEIRSCAGRILELLSQLAYFRTSSGCHSKNFSKFRRKLIKSFLQEGFFRDL